MIMRYKAIILAMAWSVVLNGCLEYRPEIILSPSEQTIKAAVLIVGFDDRREDQGHPIEGIGAYGYQSEKKTADMVRDAIAEEFKTNGVFRMVNADVASAEWYLSGTIWKFNGGANKLLPPLVDVLNLVGVPDIELTGEAEIEVTLRSATTGETRGPYRGIGTVKESVSAWNADRWNLYAPARCADRALSEAVRQIREQLTVSMVK